MQTKTILKKIALTPESFRRGLMQDAQRHAIKQANGDYWFNEDTNQWEGYDTVQHVPAPQKAVVGRTLEKDIIKRIVKMTGTDAIPEFITYNDDPRGFVLKIKSDKLTEEERTYCHSLGFAMDWGGDFAIVSNDMLPQLYETLRNRMNVYAQAMGRIRTEKKARASKENGKRGGYWKQKRNKDKNPTGLNALYERVDNSQKQT